MKDLFRSGFAIAIGIALAISVQAFLHRQPSGISIQPEIVINFLKVVQPSFLGAVAELLPWFITGLIAIRLPVACGALAAAIASLVDSASLISLLSPDYLPQLVASSVALAIIDACYGAAGAALGSAARGSNNSFKPTPHRGVGHVPALR